MNRRTVIVISQIRNHDVKLVNKLNLPQMFDFKSEKKMIRY